MRCIACEMGFPVTYHPYRVFEHSLKRIELSKQYPELFSKIKVIQKQ